MGGFGSGRSGGRPTTEDGPKLTLSKLLRDQSFQPGFATSGSLVWTNTTLASGPADRLRSPSRPGIGARAAEVHDHPMGRGKR